MQKQTNLYERVFLKHFTKFTRKKPALKSSFVNLQTYACNAVKKEYHSLFYSTNSAKYSKIFILLTTNKWLLLDPQGWLTLGVLHIVCAQIFLKFWQPSPPCTHAYFFTDSLPPCVHTFRVYTSYFSPIFIRLEKVQVIFFYAYVLYVPDPGDPRSLVRKHTFI